MPVSNGWHSDHEQDNISCLLYLAFCSAGLYFSTARVFNGVVVIFGEGCSRGEGTTLNVRIYIELYTVQILGFIVRRELSGSWSTVGFWEVLGNSPSPFPE